MEENATSLKPTTESGRVKMWLDRVNVARKYRDRLLDDYGVERFVKEYYGEYDVRLGNVVAPPINDVYAYTQATIAGLSFKDPYISVNAKKKGTILGSHILEAAVNYYWRELQTKQELELELLDVVLAGHAWHKVGTSTKTVGTGSELKLASEKLYSDRVSWRDIVFNIGSRRPPIDCQWMAQRIVKPTADVKEQYQGTSKLEGGPHPALNESEIKYAQFKDDLNYSVLWEIWDAKSRKVYLVAEGFDKFLKQPMDWPDFMDEYPFQFLWFNAMPDQPYPIPDIRPWEPQILEKIKLIAMALNHVKRWNRQLLVHEGAIKQSELDKLEKGIDGSFIFTTEPVSQAAMPLQYAALQPEIFSLLPMLENIANNVNGQPAVDRGASSQVKTRTLGELEMIKSGAKSRTDRKVDRFETHIENIARQLIAHMKANFDLEKVVKITGKEPQEIIAAFGDKYDPQSKTIVFTKEDIQGEYDVEVKAGSTLPLDNATKRAILQEVLGAAEKLAQLPQLPPFIQVVISELLRDFDIKELEVAFEAQNQQAAQEAGAQGQNKAIELEKIQAETSKREAQAKNINTKTAIETATALHQANQAGVLPEAIKIGQGMGALPSSVRG